MSVKVLHNFEKATFYEYISDINTVLGYKQSLTVFNMVKLLWLTSDHQNPFSSKSENNHPYLRVYSC